MQPTPHRLSEANFRTYEHVINTAVTLFDTKQSTHYTFLAASLNRAPATAEARLRDAMRYLADAQPWPHTSINEAAFHRLYGNIAVCQAGEHIRIALRSASKTPSQITVPQAPDSLTVHNASAEEVCACAVLVHNKRLPMVTFTGTFPDVKDQLLHLDIALREQSDSTITML